MKRVKRKIVFILTIGGTFFFFLLLVGMISAAMSAFEKQDSYSYDGIQGIPNFITLEMIEGAIEEREAYGYPASVTLAQIIVESGYGRYGPGGESGKGLSQLAYDYKNLFGIKAPAGDSIPIGVINMQTGEEYNGINETVNAGFLIFRTYSDCIRYRSGLLQRKYSDVIDGVSDPDEFAKNIAGRWATDSQYATKLIQAMTQYNLYQFDEMAVEDIQNFDKIQILSAGQIRLREIALSLDDQGCAAGMCQAWVANVYQAAGQSPRQSRACATEAGNDFIRSGSKDNIPVGATVYGHSYNYNTSCGNHDAGHVGIYVGDGKIVSRENKVQVKTLDQWINDYGWRGWGWNGNEDFSEVQLGGLR